DNLTCLPSRSAHPLTLRKIAYSVFGISLQPQAAMPSDEQFVGFFCAMMFSEGMTSDAAASYEHERRSASVSAETGRRRRDSENASRAASRLRWARTTVPRLWQTDGSV